ncbi:MAG: hypothetical protein M1838_003177 [Thelocarpon superellum]|nr:MAG: hypothetical protein M1838_003177 [Thelocarpon superellum]
MPAANGYTALDRDGPSPKRPGASTHINGVLADPPTPRSPSTTGTSFTSSSHPPDLPIYTRLSPVSSLADKSPFDGVGSPTWSSAVGRATTGKSGRVIEKLQAENDRLRRELRLEVLRREEEQRKGEMTRSKIESLQTTNDNLLQIQEADRSSLARRERKMEEMRTDLDAERARRKEIDTQLRALLKEGEQLERQLRARAREEAERAKKATSQYDVLSTSWRQLDANYRRKLDKLRVDLATVNQEGAEDRAKLDRLEITVEQQRQEVDKMRVAKEAITAEFATFKYETEESTRAMRERAQSNDVASTKALEDTLRVLGEMKHVINVKKFVRHAE